MYGPQQLDDKKRALQLQSQADQPVYGPRNPPAGGLPTPLKQPAKPSLAEGDLAQAAVGAADSAVELAKNQQPTNGPSVRFGVPSRRAEQPAPAALSPAEVDKAKQWAGGVSDRASGAAVAAVKANPDSLPPTASGNESSPAAPSAPAGQQTGRDAYLKTGIGQGAVGGEIVGRVGADGVPEFTNDSKAQAAAVGGVPGGMGSVGDGKGTFSVMGEAGDAQRAIATFERANQIRGGVPRQRELGDNGGKVTVVRDSARAPTITELVNERRDLQLRGADRADRLADSRIATDGRATDRADQRQALDMAKGGVELAAAESSLATSQELEAIRQKLADPNLGEEERKALVDTYYTMTTSAKDRYMTVEGGTGEFGEKQASRVLDRRTGQYVDGGAPAQAAPQSKFEAGKVYRDGNGNKARFNGYDAQGNPQWENL